MQHRRLGRPLNSPIIASTSSVSLTGTGWKCLLSEAWHEKHHVFYAESGDFYQNTISRLAAFSKGASSRVAGMTDTDSWIVETSSLGPIARIKLQVIPGNFRMGILMIDLEKKDPQLDMGEIFGQIISCTFMSRNLDTQKIIPLTSIAKDVLEGICAAFHSDVMTFSRQCLAEPTAQPAYSMEKDLWNESPAGQRALLTLTWLKKRVDRTKAASDQQYRAPKRPWIFSFLTLGLSNRRRPKTPHPLDKLKHNDR